MLLRNLCKTNKCWSFIALFSRLYLVKLKVVVQLKSQQLQEVKVVKRMLGSRLVRCVRDLIQSRLYVSKIGF